MAPNDQTLGNNELGACDFLAIYAATKRDLTSAEIYTALTQIYLPILLLRTFSREIVIVLKQLGFAITEVKTGKRKVILSFDSNFF